MKKFGKLAAALAIASAASFGSAANAASITNSDGTLSPFGGIDWDSAGIAWTSGFSDTAGDTFTLYYASWATSIKQPDGTTFTTGFLDNTADGVANSVLGNFLNQNNLSYEYTIFAVLDESVVSCGLTECTFNVTGGDFYIYYQVPANADVAAGTGFTDGTLVIQGTVDPDLGTLFSTINGGQANLTGTVTYTNNTYINPSLLGTKLTSTLQLASQTNVTFPTAFDKNGDGTTEPLGDPQVIEFQADANQTFTAVPVPEPGILLLLGSAFAGLAAIGRRRKDPKA